MPRINCFVFNSALQWWCDRKLLDLLWHCVTESYICLLIFLLIFCFCFCEFLHRVTGVLSAKMGAISDPNLLLSEMEECNHTRTRRRKGCEFCFVKCLGLTMLSGHGLLLESVYKMLWSQGSIWKLEPYKENWHWRSVGCILLFLYEKVKIVGIKVILHSNQGKGKLKKGTHQFCFQRNLFQVELSLSYAMQRGWAGGMHERKSQLLWYSWLFLNVS